MFVKINRISISCELHIGASSYLFFSQTMYYFLLISHFNLHVHFPLQILEIQQLDDGSSCVVCRGQQRFRIIRHWLDVDGVVSLYNCVKEACSPNLREDNIIV